MNSRELVSKTIKGENTTGVTPIYGWVSENLAVEVSNRYGSVKNFEDYYEFYMAHIFGCKFPYDRNEIGRMIDNGIEVTPEVLLELPLEDVNDMGMYQEIKSQLEFYQINRERFCYMQTPGIFECINGAFGIENNLLYMALYPDEIREIFKRQAFWNKQFAMNVMDLGMDMIHISDDWGSQNNLMFSQNMWWDLIYPNHKIVADAVKKRGGFLSLHSDGNISSIIDGVVNLGYDVVHPWQENAGMSYEEYIKRYSNNFAILGGVCVQSVLGFGDKNKLKSEIERVFSLLKGKRWLCCTTHFVQNHCTMDELEFAFDLIKKLANK